MAKTMNDLVAQIFDCASERVWRVIDDGSRNHPFNEDCKSPIEQIVGCGLFACVFIYNVIALEAGKPRIAEFHKDKIRNFDELKSRKGLPVLSVWHQVHVENYTADFLIRFSVEKCIWVAIECDGHDFHERTKEQAAHDRARDRHFQKLGMSVLRFTGSEIWRDPVSVTDQIFEFLNSRGRDVSQPVG